MKLKNAPSATAQALQLAWTQLARGDLVTAERMLERLLRLKPFDGPALNLLSIVKNSTGHGAEAVALATSAVGVGPDVAEYHFSLGRALKSEHRLVEAAQAYERALALRADYADALVSLGIVLRMLGRLDDAVDRYRQALRIRPDFPEALSNLGNALADRIGRQVGANVTAEDLREAEAVHRRALNLDPRNANHLYNLGLVLKLTGRYDEALDLLNQSLAADSSRVDTCLQFGDLLFKEERFDLATQLFLRWLADRPGHTVVMLQLAISLTEMGDTEQARVWLDRVLAAEPDSAQARHLQGRLLQQTALTVDFTGDALASFRSSIDARPDYVEGVCSYLLTLAYAQEDPFVLLAEHQARVGAALAGIPAGTAPAQPGVGRRIRIGYVSFDFKRHSVAYFLEGILESHDHARFEVYAYKTNAGGDAVTARLQALCDQWIDCGHLSDAGLADRIRADGIDVLIDLSGLTSGSRIGVFARRPAPCQITYLGYPTTTGAACFDFRITDAVIDPPGEPVRSTEPPLRIAPSMFCYRAGPAPEIGPLPAAANGYVTFGSFNNLAKVGLHTLQLWGEVLRAVPGSRLHLKAGGLVQHAKREAIKNYLGSLGIAPDRLTVQPWMDDVQAHLNAYNALDIALDTFPFNGATTTCEALWMGVPVVTLKGRTHPSRMGASILGAVGLDELVAGDDPDFVARSARLAGDRDRLQALRAGLRARLQHSRLCDARRFTADYEGLLTLASGAGVARPLHEPAN